MEKESCSTCRFYKSAEFSAQNGKIIIDYKSDSIIGECRRYPPTLIKVRVDDNYVEYFGFPWIMSRSDKKDMWCGEHKIKSVNLQISGSESIKRPPADE